MRSALRPILEHLPPALFSLAVAVLLIGLGMAIERYRLFPRSILNDAQTTAGATFDALRTSNTGTFRGFSGTPLDGIPAGRIESPGGERSDTLLLSGGRYQFRGVCPEQGCLAVAIAPSGEVVHAWPFLLSAILAANVADEDDYPYELNSFSPERDMKVMAVEQYPDGDLLVTFNLDNAFPYGGGVARIGRDGRPRWFRRDYSHHWPRVADGGITFVPAHTLGDGAYTAPIRGDTVRLHCKRKHYRDAVHVIDGDGKLLESIPVFDILMASGYAIFDSAPPPCDPFHLNSVDIVGENADGSHGILPGDLVLSFRNISAFAILDGATYALKHLVDGAFRHQHDVTHLAGSIFLLFDNDGDWRGESRLLMIDIATGAETTIFPNDRTPDDLRGLHSAFEGGIDIAPDRLRAIATFTFASTAVEVRLFDGAVLSVVRSLHDVSGLDHFPEERHDRAAVFWMAPVNYLRGDAWPEP